MYLVDNKIMPPPEWEHDPKLINSYGNTVAIKLAT